MGDNEVCTGYGKLIQGGATHLKFAWNCAY